MILSILGSLSLSLPPPLSYKYSRARAFSRSFTLILRHYADLSAWDVTSVTDASYMFRSATSFAQPLCWDTKLPQDARTVGMFIEANASAGLGGGAGASSRGFLLRRR